MRYIDEYRNEADAQKFVRAIQQTVTRPWTIMEICGGQTHTLIKFGIDRLLPEEVTLVHGPGCPVCVTPLELIDKALAIARRPEVIFTSFGDMLRVPGSETDLLSVKANGGDVRMVYSPLDAVKLAQKHPDREVVFFAVGFETTAPANAMAIWQASQLGLTNFSILCSHVLVPPAMEALLGSPQNLVQGFLAAGHVCNVPAQNLVGQVFERCDRQWRGIGTIPQSGLRLRPEFAAFDAEQRFGVTDVTAQESPLCIAGEILLGLKKPHECAAFGQACTPEHPLGAPMVSSEGACAAYYQYGRAG